MEVRNAIFPTPNRRISSRSLFGEELIYRNLVTSEIGENKEELDT